MAAKSHRILAPVGALIVSAAVMAGCGDDVPGNSVARIDDAVIKKSTFEHWLGIAAKSSQPPGSTTKILLPDPPDYKKCIANKIKTAPKPAKGQPKPTPTQFKTQCKQEYEGQRDQVMQFLISNEWLKGEASDQGVKVTDAEIKKEYEKQKKQSFPKEADFQKFLKSSGYTIDDLLLRVEQDLLTNKIREKVQKGKNVVTEKRISEYYKKNKARFAQPERRDLQVVLTKTKARADSALQRIQTGEGFAKVAKALSIDQASKSQQGKLLAVTKGQQEKAFDRAIFSAQRGQLRGPVKTQFGYYVFRVTKVTKASQQTLAQAKETIRQLLRSEGEQKALDGFVKKFEKKWKDRTDCKKGFVVQSCKDYKAPKTPTGAGGQVPGGAQQVPVPQGGAQQVPAPQQNVPPAQQGG